MGSTQRQRELARRHRLHPEHPAHVRRLFYQSLLATLTKATANMASALTIAAFEASAADSSSATNPAFPPDLTPSNADTDHSDDAEF